VGQVVQGIAQGMAGTVLMYGQTGSGKTYTMSAIHERAARELFDCLAKEVGPLRHQKGPPFTLFKPLIVEKLHCFDARR
jgi:hypothetical protein